MKKIFILTIGLFCLSLTHVRAQSQTAITYAVGFGMGDLGDFISKTSWRGVALDYRYKVNPSLGIGATLGWNVFYEAKPLDTYTVGNESITGKQYRYSNELPILFSGDYYLNAGEKMSPFFGVGAGVLYTRRNTDMGVYTRELEAWSFALQPEIGIQFNHNLSSATTLSVKYFHGFAGGDLDEDQSYLTVNLGFVFKQF